jgi:hypothetical protein
VFARESIDLWRSRCALLIVPRAALLEYPTMTASIPRQTTDPAPVSHHPAIPLDLIAEPGAYVCNWNGYLMRVPSAALEQGVRRFNLVGSEPLFVTKISDDPDVPVRHARHLAADGALNVAF